MSGFITPPTELAVGTSVLGPGVIKLGDTPTVSWDVNPSTGALEAVAQGVVGSFFLLNNSAHSRSAGSWALEPALTVPIATPGTYLVTASAIITSPFGDWNYGISGTGTIGNIYVNGTYTDAPSGVVKRGLQTSNNALSGSGTGGPSIYLTGFITLSTAGSIGLAWNQIGASGATVLNLGYLYLYRVL